MIQFANTRHTSASEDTERRGGEAERVVEEAGRRRDEVERLGDEIARLAAHIHAATYRLLVMIREFDRREGWGGGFQSCAHWLSWRTGIAPGPSREKVRVARALADLPLISGAMERGALSFSKARALTRVATAENEEALLELSEHATAAHIEKIVRAWRRVDRQEDAAAEKERHESRYVHLHVDEDGMYVLRGRLDPEVGELLAKALAAAADALFRKSEDAADAAVAPIAEQRRADALGLIAERYQVVLHVEADTGASVLESSGIGVPAGTSGRLSCDADLVVMTHDRDGTVHEEGFTVELDDGGRPQFRRPDGRPLAAVPPAPRLGENPVADLEREHRSRGVAPGAHTTTPLWHGERLDLGLAIDVLRV